MQSGPLRQTVDLAEFPDLVLVQLGFRVRRWRGVPAFLRLGKGLREIERRPPDGLLSHEMCLYSWNHVGMRQHWRDLESLERFTRSQPHASWWQAFRRDAQGCGFWHEAWTATGGVEAIYVDMESPVGLARFAPIRAPAGPLTGSRGRLDAHRARG